MSPPQRLFGAKGGVLFITHCSLPFFSFSSIQYATTPVANPVTTLDNRKMGSNAQMARLRTNRRTAKVNCVILCAHAPQMLIPITLNPRGHARCTSAITAQLAMAPPEERRKAGLRKVPISSEPRNTRMPVTAKAPPAPTMNSASKEATFPNPIFSHGKGRGKIPSNINRMSPTDASNARCTSFRPFGNAEFQNSMVNFPPDPGRSSVPELAC